ncbi:redoxin domain-containing protein [Dactylosporangium sp. CA-139114]|uniref:redoxin domain-containing protein n=1 Tax=Dactylosporangium sp. CA-139114 TaxID=3239931 RepID=UPI003D9846DD
MARGQGLLPPGQEAPNFVLPSTPDQHVALSDLRGGPVVLAFYPADWSPVCGDQMALYQAVLPEFARYNAIPVGISVDGVWCHRAFAENRAIRFPLLADFHPKGDVARQYGAYSDDDGVAERALYVIDPEGMVSWSHLSPRGLNPGADGILNALADLSAERKGAQMRPDAHQDADMAEQIAGRREANQARRDELEDETP